MESITEPTKREVELEEALEAVIDILEHKKPNINFIVILGEPKTWRK